MVTNNELNYIEALKVYSATIGNRLNRVVEQAAEYGWYAGQEQKFLQELNQELRSMLFSSIEQQALIERLRRLTIWS